MDLLQLLSIIRRWLWLIVSLVLVTAIVMVFRARTAPPVYEATVKLQLTAPQQEDVALYDRYRSSSLRDETTIARNNFIELLKSREVYNRTIRQLHLKYDDAAYTVEVTPMRDADFLSVTVSAPSARQAEEIANAHVNAAIAYYGEVRAKPATGTKNFLAEQLRVAEEEFQTSLATLTEFQTKNGISTLDNELGVYQKLMEQLQIERNRRVLEGASNQTIQTTLTILERLQAEREIAVARGENANLPRYDDAIKRYADRLAELRQTTSATEGVDLLIDQRKDEMDKLVGLGPRYNVLQENVRQARENYQLILNKYTEAVLKENTIQAASFIQVVEPAIAPSAPTAPRLRTLMILGMLGSLGLGVLLAFVLETLKNLSPARARPLAVEPVDNGD